jgi:hypothetical protein
VNTGTCPVCGGRVRVVGDPVEGTMHYEAEPTTAESLTINTRSMTSALRDFATLLEAGDAAFVVGGLRSLAARVEEMAHDQAAPDG